MTLPQTVSLCDALEVAAIDLKQPLSLTDLSRLFFPGQDWDGPADLGDAPADSKLRDALGLTLVRRAACGEAYYPFDVSNRSIKATSIAAFDLYIFLLLGRTLNFGGPKETDALLRGFREHFEDVVCWAMRRAGFLAEVLSELRLKRGLPVELAPALRELANRFGEAAVLVEDKLVPDDNDLDVDVLAVPAKGNGKRGGWPVVLIQCATGAVKMLQSKVDEGAKTFSTVWDDGFFSGTLIRGGATPYELLGLAQVHWNRLSVAGWILDRTRIVHLASVGVETPLPPEVSELWEQLWAARHDIDWRTGWQEAG